MKLIPLLSSYIILYLRLRSPDGDRAITAENSVLEQQLIAMSHGQKRGPRLTFIGHNIAYGPLPIAT